MNTIDKINRVRYVIDQKYKDVHVGVILSKKTYDEFSNHGDLGFSIFLESIGVIADDAFIIGPLNHIKLEI